MAIPPVDPARRDKLFPLKTDDPPARTFEIGMVLGGTVSAGAYTAGALDFLIEALEAWHADPNPLHRVVLTMAGGASGGAVCSAILGLLSGRPVPHVKVDATPHGQEDTPVATGNPLWDLWVNEFRITPMLQVGDLGGDADAGSGKPTKPGDSIQRVPSLIDCLPIDDYGEKLVAMGSTPSGPLPYFAAPFRVAVTLANLRGVPYKTHQVPPIQGLDFSGVAYLQHDDFSRFAFPNGASPTPTATSLGKREDEFWLDTEFAGTAPGIVGYDVLMAHATASGAMPIGLRARALSRPAEQLHYRPRVRAIGDAPGFEVLWPEPDWDQMEDTAATGVYTFTSVDGGTFNNDPVGLVHTALAGLIGQNFRDSSTAKRAMFMIDPLADPPQPVDNVGTSLVSVFLNMIPTFVQECRYQTADMVLFADDDVCSRYQLVPFRQAEKKVGEAALAGTSFMAVAGWCSRAFRVHDFMLGRQNMQDYMRRELILKADNTLFDGWSDGDRMDGAVDANGNRVPVDGTTPHSNYYLPILPDKTLNGPLPVPAWPKDQYNPDNLTDVLKNRLEAVGRRVVGDNVGGVLAGLIEGVAIPPIAGAITDAVVASFKDELKQAGLLS
jgi:hypothetical protein